jgi:hypothetical protein
MRDLLPFRRAWAAPLIAFIFLAFLLSWTAATKATKGSSSGPSKIDKQLAAEMAGSRRDETFGVVFKLAAVQPPRGSAKKNLTTLKTKTAASQADLAAELKAAKSRGSVKAWQGFWVTNAVVVAADAETINRLAARPEVEAVFPNFNVSLIDPVRPKNDGRTDPGPTAGPEWNLSRIGAPEVWGDFSVDGTGAQVAVLDTGIDPNHPDLVGKVGAFVEVDYMGKVKTATPKDTQGHGTHVAGTIAGGGAGGTSIGVAPGAELMGAIVLPGGSGTFAQVIGGMQWAADPDGDPSTSDQPDAVNMSLGGPGLMAQMFEPIDNLAAAGVFPAIAVGNWGPGDVSSPSDVPTAFAVGATDELDEVAWFSGGGEVTWHDPPHAGRYVKPDATAPGVNIRSSVPGGGHASWSGTSMATPHVAGTVALLRQLEQSLSVEQISGIFQTTAVDLGEPGKDVRYGGGRLNAYGAAALAQSFGTVTGVVTVAEAGVSADIALISEADGTQAGAAIAGPDGRYELQAAPGDYHVNISKFGYNSTASAPFSLSAGGVNVFSPALTEAVRHNLSGAIKNASGTALAGSVSILSPISSTKKAPAGLYSFDLPDGSYLMRADAYGYKTTEATITIIGGDTTADFTLNKVSPILLVIDWAAGPYLDFFTAALGARAHDVADLSDPQGWSSQPQVDADFLSQYKQVVWAAGDGPASGAWPSSDTETMRARQPALASYLDGGGKLLLTGQDVAYYLDWWKASSPLAQADPANGGYSDDFLRGYLHARLLKDKANNLTITGNSNTLFSDRTMSLLGGDGANNQYWPDVLATDELSIPELVYTKEPVGSASLRTYSGQDETGKVVYFGFGLEGINSAPDRSHAVSQALGWLDAPSGTLSTGPTRQTITGSSAATLTGQLSPGRAGETITIERKFVMWPGWDDDDDWDDWDDDDDWDDWGPTTVWLPVATAKTGSTGAWNKKLYPVENSVYRAVWAGDVEFGRTISRNVKINVKPLISAQPSLSPVPVGTKTHLKGYMNPASSDGTIMRVRKRAVGTKKWVSVKDVYVRPSGVFSISVKPSRHTDYRLISMADEKLQSGSSASIRVRSKHQVALQAETGLAPKGIPIELRMTVPQASPGATARLQRKVDGSWRSVNEVELTSSKKAVFTYAAKKAGSFDFRIVMPADKKHDRGVSNTERVRFY